MPATMVIDQKNVVAANIRVPMPTGARDFFRRKNAAQNISHESMATRKMAPHVPFVMDGIIANASI